MRVIVVGGGIGGVTAALALAHKGFEVEIYEQAGELAEVGAGVSLWPNALKALHQLGLGAALEAMSFVSSEGAIRQADGAVLSRTCAPEFVRRFGLPPMVFHRAELLDALLNAARHVPLHLGHECRDLAQDAGSATAHFANGVSATAAAIVAADGLRSGVRTRLGVAGELRYAGYTAWRGMASFETRELIAGETFGCGQRFGLVPLTGNRVYWYATDNVPEGQREPPAAAQARLLALFDGWHAPIRDLIAATEPARILRNDIYDRDPVNRWGAGRITLLGDAAHPMTPNLGQGACQAIEDALVLAAHLATGFEVESSLRAYERERMARTRPVVQASRRVGRMGQVEGAAACRLRNLLLRMIPGSMTYRHLAPVVGYEGHLGR